MSYELSYADVQFQLITKALEDALSSRLATRDTRVTSPVSSWPGRNLAAIAFPNWPSRPELRLGQFFYPVGISRWAEFNGVMDSDGIATLLPLIQNHSTGHTPQTFLILADAPQDTDAVTGIQTPMYMLPPRPLFTADGTGVGDGLYHVTLVDDRYWAHLQPAGVPSVSSTVTWASLVSQLVSALAITFDMGSVPSNAAYGTPSLDSGIWTNLENTALLLDAVAWNLGCFVVRAFNGTYSFVPFGGKGYTSLRRPHRMAGGSVFDDPFLTPDSAGLLPALELVLPKYVTVAFPQYVADYGYLQQPGDLAAEQPVRYIPWIRESFPECYLIQVGLNQATGTDPNGQPLSSYSGIMATKGFHSTARAYYTNFTDGSPNNTAALTSLATQLANDYWNSLANGIDEVYPGIRNWTPDQTHDILCTYRQDACYTRLQRLPWNTSVDQFSHFLSGNDGPNANPAIEIVRAATGTPDGSGRYDAYTQRRDNSPAYTDVERVWLHPRNGETLTVNQGYLARLMRYESGRKLYTTVVASGSPANPLTVELSDTSVTVNNVNTIELDVPADWTLTSPSVGHARMATKGYTGSLVVCSPDGTTHTVTWNNGLTKTVV